MIVNGRFGAVIALGVLLAACAGDSTDQAAAAEARCAELFPDGAAGAPSRAPVVTSARPLWREGEAPRAAATPLVSIGSGTGDANYEFGEINGATRLADGRIIVADGQLAALMVYDAQGAFVARAGRRGQGPGEFRTVTELYRGAGDTLWVYDLNGRRITALDPSFQEVSRHPLVMIPFSSPPARPGDRPNAGAMVVQLRGRLADGHWIGVHRAGGMRFVTDPVTEVRRDTMVVRVVDTASGSADSIGTLLTDESFNFLGDDRSITFGPTLAGPIEAVAVASDRWYTGPGERFEIEERSSDGSLVRLIRLCEPRDSIPDARVQEMIAHRLAGYDEETLRYEEPPMRELPKPVWAPAHLELLIDGADRLWARDFTYPSEPRRWKVFDREGRWLGDVETPADLTVLEVGTDYVLGRHTDALGVQSIRIYALE
jgi:hypothetical protein